VSTSPINERAGSEPKPRIAVALSPATETEVVALVAALDTVGALDRLELVVPALDVEQARSRICALLPDASAVRIEPMHEYLQKGHDRAALIGDDARERGRSMAAVLTAMSDTGDPASSDEPSPAEVVAWLARSWAPSVLDALRPDGPRPGEDVLLRSRGTSAMPLAWDEGRDDPAAIRFVERSVSAEDAVFDATPGAGEMTIRAARLVGPRGHVVASAGPGEVDRLRDNLALNGVSGWSEVVTIAEPLDLTKELGRCERLNLLRIDRAADDDGSYLDAAAAALLGGHVARLLTRVAPSSIRPVPDPVRVLFETMRARVGAAFAIVVWDGSVRTSTVDDLFAGDDIRLVAVDMPGAA
jgi:hypothetical protein